MGLERPDTTAARTSTPQDTGLRCPECEYNLTGLAEPRCPECGGQFSWDVVRALAEDRPVIAFERARGWRKVPAFFVTWATVLFTPWVFARQAVVRVGARDAVVFGLACFAATAGGFATDLGPEFWATWICTAAVYVGFQAVWLTLLDWPNWRRPMWTLRFWLLVTCYTSAVMATEFVHGPPPVFLEDLWTLIHGNRPSGWFDEMYEWDVDAVVWWAQLGLWLAALAFVYAARLRRARYPATVVWPAAVIVAVSLLVLYSATLTYVGTAFDELF